MDTIFALATGALRAAVAVVRLSGPQTPDILVRLAGPCPAPRQASLRALRSAEGEILDRALVLWFPAPASFTGEDVAELQLHGGRAVVAAVLSALSATGLCRPAEPGEFTRRAFLNDRLDLEAVEGLADLIDAETQAQRRQAQRHLDGALGRWVEGLRDDLLAALALAEGTIDFADEDAVEQAYSAEIEALTDGVLSRIDRELRRHRSGAKLRDGLVVALTGPPNAGKSTLLNLLAGRDIAIVSAHAGTTRDVIEVALELDGQPVLLIDTAGIRDSMDPIEQEGIARARGRARSADLVLWLHGPGDPAEPDIVTEGALWSVGTKGDLLQGPDPEWLSARTGAGIDRLLERLTAYARASLSEGESALVTTLRQRDALMSARAAIAEARDRSGALELVAESLRRASTALDRLVGRIGTEEILGVIFSRFCIGK